MARSLEREGVAMIPYCLPATSEKSSVFSVGKLEAAVEGKKGRKIKLIKADNNKNCC